jgi:hypothetical protein
MYVALAQSPTPGGIGHGNVLPGACQEGLRALLERVGSTPLASLRASRHEQRSGDRKEGGDAWR